MPEYYKTLKLLDPKLDSKLSETIFNVEKLWLRWDSVLFAKLKKTTIPETVFRALQSLFKTVESVASARIEWNHTTISQYVANRNNWIKKEGDEWNKEIENISNAIDYIHEAFEREENPRDFQINRLFLSELHYILMDGLSVWTWKEWADTPWSFRHTNVEITQSDHTPPDYTQVNSYMDELLEFINREDNQLFSLNINNNNGILLLIYKNKLINKFLLYYWTKNFFFGRGFIVITSNRKSLIFFGNNFPSI